MNEPSETPRLRERIYDLFPTLERGERKQLVERIAVGADGGVDFVVMMLLAATLASLGLLEGSTAVVIGAMLVAPLMGPLLAAGFALAQGNLRLFRDALAEAGITLVLSTAVGLQAGIREELAQVIRNARRNQNAIVRVFILQEAAVAVPEAP